jgi:mannose-6-phosphate isomerase-like protein (cupin superfamily)
MKEQVRHNRETAEYFFEEGCHIVELSNSAQDPELSVARVRVEPGETTRLHRLAGVTERYVILQGEGLVEVGDIKDAKVGAGDVVIIPPDSPQRISNVSSNDLIFLALCTPRFTKECYQVQGDSESDADTDAATSASSAGSNPDAEIDP